MSDESDDAVAVAVASFREIVVETGRSLLACYQGNPVAERAIQDATAQNLNAIGLEFAHAQKRD